MDPINEQSQTRGEDGRFVSATPQPDATAQAAPVAAPDAPTAPASVAPADDVYESVARKMNAAAKAAIPSETAVVPDPQATTDAAAPTPPGHNTRDAETPPSPSPDDKKAADALAPYAGSLSKQQFDLLKSVPGMLLPADEWRKLTPAEQVEHLQDVRQIRSERMRQINANKNNGRPPQASADDRQTSETGQPPRAGGTLEGDGVPVPAAPRPAGQAAATAAGLPPAAAATLAQLANEFGEDSSIYQATLLAHRENAEMAQRLAQMDQARQSEAQARATERQIRSFEDAQFEQLKAKYPQLTDPNTRDELRQAARDYYALRQQQGRPVEDREALRFVTHNTLYPQIQQHQQTTTQANRQRSLAGTFDRATPPTPQTPAQRAAADNGDPYASVAQRLNRVYAGGTQPGEAARLAARAMAG